MADFYISGAALLFLGWLAVVQIKNWAHWRSLKRFGDANGCGDVVVVPNKLPGGLDRVFMTFMNGKIKFIFSYQDRPCDGRINAMVEMLKVQRSRCIVKY
jgi:hypothetical protein